PPASPPTDVEVARVVATIRTRVLCLLRRRGVFTEAADDDATDPLAETSLALARITSAAVQGRSALGPRARPPVLQIRRAPGPPPPGAHPPPLGRVPPPPTSAGRGNNPGGRGTPPPPAPRPRRARERLPRTADGRVLLTLKTEWSDGTTALLFEPMEFLERLA